MEKSTSCSWLRPLPRGIAVIAATYFSNAQQGELDEENRRLVSENVDLGNRNVRLSEQLVSLSTGGDSFSYVDVVPGDGWPGFSGVRDAFAPLVRQAMDLSNASTTARQALERAKAAGKLAEGKLLYEAILTSDEVRFDLDKSNLSDSAQQALDVFALELKEGDRNVFVEIQGHTDDTGTAEHNFSLGQRRAEEVRRYLNQAHQIPLHRMSIISYGESAPLVANDSRENRATNRRVSLVVLI